MRAGTRMRFPDRYQAGQLDRLTRGNVAGKLRLAEQYRALQKGDVARRLELPEHASSLADGHRRTWPSHIGGAPGIYRPHQARPHPGRAYYHGRISPYYGMDCFRFHYHGHRYFAGVYWYPRWTDWVSSTWHYHCRPIWDPRPLWCRPVVYVPCPRWIVWETPVWVPLPVVSCGTWVDVPPVVVARQYDLQLLAVRFVDPGHPDENLGPRYRVWFRNNSDHPTTQPFNVMLFAAANGGLSQDLPQAGVRVTSIEAGDTQSVDIRLPIEVYSLGGGTPDSPVPFSTLHVLVDSHREVTETSEANNGLQIPRENILPVDPAAFEVDPIQAVAGDEVVLAGEGFGPQPGQLLVQMAGLELEGEILGWYDLGVRATLPNVPLAGPTPAELIVIRGDGAAANPLKITITPPRRAGPEIIPPGPPQ
jgi:hypothetical protein